MSRFNNGKSYHGSHKIMRGKLQGATDNTDYFYFFCPECPDKHIMRILDFEVRKEEENNPYNSQLEKKARIAFTLAFKLYCESCGYEDFIKISNTGWQGGTHSEALLEVRG